LTAGSMDVRNLARLGNFDGTGSDDLAVTFDGANGFAGAVFIVKGSSSFASRTIPNAANAIEIDGPAGAALGATTIGIGPFFQSSGGGPGLLTTAVLTSTVYAFAGQSPPGTLTTAAANDSAVEPAADRYGNSLSILGAFGTSPMAVTVGAPGGRYVDLYLGSASTGPIIGAAGAAPSPTVRFVDGASGNSFGVINVGGGVKGTAQSLSLTGGDSTPDLVLAGQAETGQPIYIVEGAAMLTMSGTVDVSTLPSTAVKKLTNIIPADWAGYSVGTVIPDSNGDGFPDFALGENVGTAGSGRVVIFY